MAKDNLVQSNDDVLDTEVNNTITVLTDENYYEDTLYLSASRFKEYMKCPLKQQKIELGLWEKPESKTALLVGNYTHSYFESPEAHAQFIEKNKEAMVSSRGKTAGQIKSEFKVADKMIESLEKEDLFNLIYHGNSDDMVIKEKILTGFIHGVPFKCKIDSLNISNGYFVDLKTMDTISGEKFSPAIHRYTKGVVYNVLEYNYDLQMYIYQTLIEQEYGYPFTPYIVAVSKEKVPDKEIFRVDQAVIDSGKEIFESYIDTIGSILMGFEEPYGCGHCDYCLSHKTLDHIIELSDF